MWEEQRQREQNQERKAFKLCCRSDPREKMEKNRAEKASDHSADLTESPEEPKSSEQRLPVTEYVCSAGAARAL